MKKLITMLLLLGSTAVMAVGPVFEQGVDSSKTISCDPPTTRAPNSEGVEVPLPLGELAYTTIRLLNEDTNIAQTSQADVNCSKVVDLNTTTPGQYKITATATDTGDRTSINSEPAYFLLIPTVLPPNAPTGITIQ